MPRIPDNHKITQLINAWRKGDQGALDELTPYVYAELKRLAHDQMQREGRGHTLQATALVHEAFLRLGDVDTNYNDRSHFLAMAARTVRHILVDHARRKKSAKRGGPNSNLPLDEEKVPGTEQDWQILDLDCALEKLARNDEQLASAIELVYFGGLSYDEAAELQGVSRTRLADDLKLARAWLRVNMTNE